MLQGYIPMNYDKINNLAGQYMPSQVKPFNNHQYRLWTRALFQRACSTIEITLPEIWDKHYELFYWCLFAYGFVGMGDMAEIGKWFNPVTLSGYNFYYEPTMAILTNPALKSDSGRELTIGKDCELLKLSPDYMGIYDVISYYAEKLACLDVAINTAIINTKFAYVIGAKNKAAAEVLKKLFDKVNSGEPAVFFDKRLANDPNDNEEPWQALFRDNIAGNYIITDLLRDFQTVINDFDTEVGIPTIPYEKKERMVTDEANSRQTDSITRLTTWLECFNESAENVNKMFGTNISAEMHFKPEEEEEENVDNENDNLRIE